MWYVRNTTPMALPCCVFESAPSGLKILPCPNWGSRITMASPTKQCQPCPGTVTHGSAAEEVCVPWIQPFPGVQRSLWYVEVSGLATLQPPIPEDKRFQPAPYSADIFSEYPSPAPGYHAWPPSNTMCLLGLVASELQLDLLLGVW